MYMYATLSVVQTFSEHFVICYFSDFMFLVLYSFYNNVLLFLAIFTSSYDARKDYYICK